LELLIPVHLLITIVALTLMDGGIVVILALMDKKYIMVHLLFMEVDGAVAL
jgi:hypothetical protein